MHAVVLTHAGKVVLVRLTYATGWYLPGCGRKRRETAREATLRELREEIGLTAWRAIEPLGESERLVAGRSATNTLFEVRGAEYRPRWSLEIEAVVAFARAELPADLAA